jgi:hypothetical protein
MRPLDRCLEAVDSQNAAAFLDEAASVRHQIRAPPPPNTRASINCAATSGPAERPHSRTSAVSTRCHQPAVVRCQRARR